MKFSFKNDYSEGCHPKILEALSQYNLDQQNGYGLDIYSENTDNLSGSICITGSASEGISDCKWRNADSSVDR